MKKKTRKVTTVIAGEIVPVTPMVSTSNDKPDISGQRPLPMIKPPKWVADAETLGTAMMQTAQEFLLVIEDALMRYHGFKEEDINKLHKEITPVLQGVKEFEEHGLSLLSPRDIGIVAELAEARLLKERAWKVGLETPILAGAKPFLKKLEQKNNEAVRELERSRKKK